MTQKRLTECIFRLCFYVFPAYATRSMLSIDNRYSFAHDGITCICITSIPETSDENKFLHAA